MCNKKRPQIVKNLVYSIVSKPQVRSVKLSSYMYNFAIFYLLRHDLCYRKLMLTIVSLNYLLSTLQCQVCYCFSNLLKKVVGTKVTVCWFAMICMSCFMTCDSNETGLMKLYNDIMLSLDSVVKHNSSSFGLLLN